MKPKHIAVLGGSGFLGKNLISTWAKEPTYRLIVGDLLPDKNLDIEYKELDLLRIDSVKNVLKGTDLVINLIGQVTRPMEKCLSLNSIGIQNLANSLTPAQHLIHISTVSVYGSSEFVDENSMLSPETPYGSAKANAENLLRAALNQNQLTIVRLPNLYGPNQPKGVLAYLLRSHTGDQHLDFDNDGTLLRYYLHTQDCADLLKSFIDQPTPGIFNFPGEGPYTIHELIQLAEEVLNCSFVSHFREISPPDNISRMSWDRLKDQFAFKLNWTIRDFLKLKD